MKAFQLAPAQSNDSRDSTSSSLDKYSCHDRDDVEVHRSSGTLSENVVGHDKEDGNNEDASRDQSGDKEETVIDDEVEVPGDGGSGGGG